MHIKRVSTIAVACLGAIAGANAGATEAPIQSVTLYPGGATVERVLQVTPGMRQIEITGLLANFDTDTVRLQADPGIQVGQVVTRDLSRVDSPNPREAELDARRQALDDQIALIDADIKAAGLAQGYLERLGSGAGNGGAQAAPDAKSLAGTLDAIRRGGLEALDRIQADEVKKRALVKQRDAVKRDLAKAQGEARDNRVMAVSVAVRQSGRIVLSYQVSRAGWKPAYRAALDSNASTIDLERLATISQKTGEDWSGVKLRLSTGQPNQAAAAPDPGPWLLDYFPPAPPAPPGETMYRFSAPAPASAPPQQIAVTGSAVKRDDYIAPVLQIQGNFDTEFEVPARVDLASDGREIAVGLAHQSLPARQQVLVAPRSSGVAVLSAEAARPDGVWLPGQVQTYRDGSYVGAAAWNPDAGERLRFGFGRDALVRVVIERGDRQSGEAGFLGRDDQRRIARTYAVTSLHRQPIDVRVLEATPVSQSDKVEVKAALKPEPTVREWEHRRGVVAWDRTLAPNETARFEADYVIDYPKEGTVQGLP